MTYRIKHCLERRLHSETRGYTSRSGTYLLQALTQDCYERSQEQNIGEYHEDEHELQADWLAIERDRLAYAGVR